MENALAPWVMSQDSAFTDASIDLRMQSDLDAHLVRAHERIVQIIRVALEFPDEALAGRRGVLLQQLEHAEMAADTARSWELTLPPTPALPLTPPAPFAPDVSDVGSVTSSGGSPRVPGSALSSPSRQRAAVPASTASHESVDGVASTTEAMSVDSARVEEPRTSPQGSPCLYKCPSEPVARGKSRATSMDAWIAAQGATSKQERQRAQDDSALNSKGDRMSALRRSLKLMFREHLPRPARSRRASKDLPIGEHQPRSRKASKDLPVNVMPRENKQNDANPERTGSSRRRSWAMLFGGAPRAFNPAWSKSSPSMAAPGSHPQTAAA